MNSTVRPPPACSRSRASATALRRSATPAETAETGTKSASVLPAMMRASVVLPVPGGPQRIIEGRRAALDQPAQELPLADDVLLPDVLVERARPHPRGERRARVRRVVGGLRLEHGLGLTSAGAA